jgi:FkbM family methyltransferase
MKAAEMLATALGRALFPLRFRGKARVAQTAAHAVSFVTPRARCSPAKGATMTVVLADRIQAQMWAGAYQPETSRILSRSLRQRGVFLDVGAHVGYFSMLAAAHVGTNGQVYAFEPDPMCFEALAHNANGLPQINALNVAVSDSTIGETLFRTPRSDEWGWSTVVPPPGPARDEIPIEAITLDGWNIQRRLNRLDAMKVSAQGFEPRILDGARGLLESLRPLVLINADRENLVRAGFEPDAVEERLTAVSFASWRIFNRHGIDTGLVLGVCADEMERYERVFDSAGISLTRVG